MSLLIYGKRKKIKMTQTIKVNNEKDITIESPILSDDINKIIIKIDENKIEDQNRICNWYI